MKRNGKKWKTGYYQRNGKFVKTGELGSWFTYFIAFVVIINVPSVLMEGCARKFRSKKNDSYLVVSEKDKPKTDLQLRADSIALVEMGKKEEKLIARAKKFESINAPLILNSKNNSFISSVKLSSFKVISLRILDCKLNIVSTRPLILPKDENEVILIIKKGFPPKINGLNIIKRLKPKMIRSNQKRKGKEYLTTIGLTLNIRELEEALGEYTLTLGLKNIFTKIKVDNTNINFSSFENPDYPEIN